MREKNKWITLFIVVCMTFMATLDSSVVNITLPVMAKSFGVSTSEIALVVVSYTGIICSTILIFGRLGDVLGKTLMFKIGVIIFTIGSLMCGISTSFTAIIISRIIQGLGGAAYMANNHGIIVELFPVKNRGKALGILTTSVAMGTLIGPVLGGAIATYLKWNYIFIINIPIGIVVMILSKKYLMKSYVKKAQLDLLGAVLQFFGIILLFLAIMKAQKLGFNNSMIIIMLISSCILIISFIIVEKKSRSPLLDVNIFRNKVLSLNLVCAFISFTCIASSTIILPFYYEYTLKLSPSITGLIFMTSPIVLGIFSPLFGGISDKIGQELLCLCGLILMSIAFLFFSFLGVKSPIVVCIVFMAIMSFGQALFQPANNSLIMKSCSKAQLGSVGSVNSLMRNMGIIFGISMSTTILYLFMSLNSGRSVSGYIFGRDDIFVYGMSNTYKVLAFVAFIGAVINFTQIIKKRANVKKIGMK